MNTLLDSVSSMVGNVSSIKSTINNVSEMSVNAVAGMLNGCVSVPKKATEVYVYFVVPRSGENHYVAGFMLSERNKILKYFAEDISYVIFAPKDMSSYGIPLMASGFDHHAKYHDMDAGQISKLRHDNPNYYYITCDKDVEYLKLRMETMGIGKVYTRDDIYNIASAYVKAMSHQRLTEATAVYQAFVDLAVANSISD